MDYNVIIICLSSYLIGSIPFAFIFTKISGEGDIRKIGSGNIGATNVLRTGNKSIAVVVLIFDILKGYLPTLYIANYLFVSNDNEFKIYLLGSLTILGHLFPIWLRFKGGKGVATYIGFIFAVNYILGIFFIFLWLFIAFIKKYSSLASIFALLAVPFIMIFLDYKPSVFLFFFILSAFLIFKHYSNIKRLIDKTESKINF